MDDKPRKPTMNDIATTPIFGQVTVSGQGSYMINLPEEIRKRDEAIRVMREAIIAEGCQCLKCETCKALNAAEEILNSKKETK